MPDQTDRSHAVPARFVNATADQKASMFEWLRSLALKEDNPHWFNAGLAMFEIGRLHDVLRGTAAFSPPTENEIAAYRDLFRRELDKNMHNSSGSPSTDAHHVALHAFVEARNRGTQSPTAPRRCREGADRDCSPACEEKARTYCSWKGF